MADKYTYADVIIDPNDPRVEIGAKYYWADIAYDVLKSANKDGGTGILEKVLHNSDLPFVIKTACDCACIIRKKEPEKKYVPFDLSDAAVREKLWGKRIVINEPYSIGGKPFKREVHSMITSFTYCMDGEPKDDWVINAGECSLNAEEALEYAHFYDETPCGKLVEVE